MATNFTYDPSKESISQYQSRTQSAIAASNPTDPNAARLLQTPQTTPAAQMPASPTPQMQTPAAPVTPPVQQPQAPQPATTVNVNTAPATPTAVPESSYQVKSGDTLNKIAQQSGMSVIDLINQNPQYAQNPNLIRPGEMVNIGKKYQKAFEDTKGTAIPESGAAARSAMDTYFEDTQQPKEDVEKAFFDNYMAMNPVVKTMYDSINQELSRPATATSFKDEFAKLSAEQGIPALQTELMNINNIMDGTEDDIRTEISKAGGIATDSQVQALKGARNKTLLKQANVLTQQLALKEDYVDRLMEYSDMDRKEVDKQVERTLGLTEKLVQIQDKMSTAAKENYQDIVDTVGYQGLADATKDNPQAQRFAEQALGLPNGVLSNPTALKYLTPLVDKKPLQFVSGTDNQASGVFDPNTGTFTPRRAGGSSGGIGGGTPGVASGSIARDAESVMSGTLNLPDISQKDNYRAKVAAEVNRMGKEALESGDIYGVMKASAVYDKEPGDTFLVSMEKLVSTIDQIGVLQENIAGTNTGPLAGLFRANNPWDTNAQTIKAQLNAIVPNLARGIYGEVGVLTDNDIKNYAKTLPTLTSTTDVRNAVLYITVDMIRRNAESKIRNQAAGQRDMSGYADTYRAVKAEADAILQTLPKSSKPGAGGAKTGFLSDGTKVTMNPDGSIVDANGNKYDKDGNIIKAQPVTIPWNSLTLKK